MKKSVEEMLAELYAIDPTLYEHEEALRRILASFPPRPDIVLDTQFVARLRRELMAAHAPASRPVASPFSQHFFFSRAALASLALVLLLGGSAYWSSRSVPGLFALAIKPVGVHAFGTIAAVPDVGVVAPSAGVRGLGAGPGMGVMSIGLGGGEPVSAYPASVQYQYRGGPFSIPAEGSVYKRIASPDAGKALVGALGSLHFGVDFGSLSSLVVRNVEVAENKDYGYAIDLNVPDGIVSINPNWETWRVHERDAGGISPDDFPADAAIIATASKFLGAHGISIKGYGEPAVDQGWRSMPVPVALDGKAAPAYAPESITVTYPLVIDGMPVYENWGGPAGLQVIVDTRAMKVQSVNNLQTLAFERSAYPLETDTQRLVELAVRGGQFSAAQSKTAGTTVTEYLATPTLVRMKYYPDPSTHNEELIVPALRFEIEGEEPADASRAILVPIIQEYVDSVLGPDSAVDNGKGGAPGVCTLEVKQCADGSFVGRVAPACEFAPCPENASSSAVAVARIGESARAGGVVITPLAVLEDSRCPADVPCIRRGTVRVSADLAAGMGVAQQEFALGEPVTTETETVTLTDVQPLAKAGTSIDPSQYQLTFTIEQR